MESNDDTQRKRNPNLWKPGQSGNPKGRPPGSPDKRGRFRRAIQEHGDAIVNVVVKAALEGDLQAAKLCIDRLAPPIKPSAETVEVDLSEAATSHARAETVLAAIARGEVPPDTGKLLLDAIGVVSALGELADMERRIAALETLRTER